MANAFNPYITPSQGAPTPATPTTLPPAGGVTVDLPIDKVNPTAADVTRTTQARLGMIDINPSARQAKDLGPIEWNYTRNSSGDITGFANGAFSHAMWQTLQHIDPLIEKKICDNPRFWHDRIPRGQFQLHNGAVHQSRTFHAGLQKYAGLDEWTDIDPRPSLTNDPCSFPKHSAYTYDWTQMAWSGMKAAWGSPQICANAFRYLEDAAQQLALILDAGMETGIQMQEVFNRDTYISKSTDFGRSYIMSQYYHGSKGSPRYFYDPRVKFGTSGSSASRTAQRDLVLGPDGQPKAFIVFDASVEPEPMNWTVMDRAREYLTMRCRDAAIGSANGDVMFGLMINSEDVDKSIEGDDRMYREWLEGKPLALIDRYNLSPRVFRRWAIVSDANQLRFKILRHVASWTVAECEKYGGVGMELATGSDGVVKAKDGVYIALAVDPRIPDRELRGMNGGPIPAENEDYIDAELAIAPVFMNNVLTNLFETQGTVNLGSGTHFGAFPALNGQWGWVLNPKTEDNPFEQIGKFYGLFLIHQKPEDRVRDTISFLYRRCKETIRAKCPIENKRVNPDAEKTTAGVTSTVVELKGLAAAEIAAGETFDVVLGKGYGPLYIGEKRVLKVGAASDPTTVNVRVVDVTQLPYATVAAEAKIDGAALSAFFTSAQGSDSKYTITGKALTGAELAVPTAG